MFAFRSLCFIGLSACLTGSPTASPAFEESPGTIEGLVRRDDGTAAHHASVMLVQTGQTVETDHTGRFLIPGVPAGTYDVFAFVAGLSSPTRLVEVRPGSISQVEFTLQFTPVHETVTVTASHRHETKFQAVQSINSLDTVQLAEKSATSIGEVLDHEPGVAKRSFGPGSARPVIRGFDGDRVLVMSDGIPVGSLGSQSGDHAEPIDPGSLERLEVVKGPATLLYGSSALGGVVNAISRHHEMHQHRHVGTRGQLISSLGSNNGLAGLNATLEHGAGPWMFWGAGGGQRTGDYSSAAGPVANSKTRISNVSTGLGWYGDRGYWSTGYSYKKGRYGIPFATSFESEAEPSSLAPAASLGGSDLQEDAAQDIDVDWNHQGLRFDGGVQDLDGAVRAVRLTASLARWKHQELEVFESGLEEVGTQFDNRQWTLRGDIEQQPRGAVGGSFGVYASFRDYEARGAEALSPPVVQKGVAVFALEEIELERLKFQFGGRLEHARYSPREDCPSCPGGSGAAADLREGLRALPERSFTGLSSAAGVRVGLWKDGALVANFSSSYRAPGLEELYNYGPHVGNLAFEIGNPSLGGERSNGFDFSLRHSGERLQGEANFFVYRISDFIFAAPTGGFEEGLRTVVYEQGTSRFVGSELGAEVGLTELLWFSAGIDLVQARLTETGMPLPRIPPLRGRLGLELRRGGFSLRPEFLLAGSQTEIFPTETPTAGYGVLNLKASYTLARQHFFHHLFFELFNAGNKLYRNHVSFIKDLAPEIGRGVRFSYSLQFY